MKTASQVNQAFQPFRKPENRSLQIRFARPVAGPRAPPVSERAADIRTRPRVHKPIMTVSQTISQNRSPGAPGRSGHASPPEAGQVRRASPETSRRRPTRERPHGGGTPIPSAWSLAVVVAGAHAYSSPLVARVSTRATPSAPLVRRKASSSRPVAVKAR